MTRPSLKDRTCGILLHPTSLPGPASSGDLGRASHQFVDFLASASVGVWQMLPVGPPGYGDSPYSAQSAFAGSPLLVALDDYDQLPERSTSNRVQFGDAWRMREPRLRELASRAPHKLVEAFIEKNASWLPDFTLFRALKRAHQHVQWTLWEKDVRDRKPAALQRAKKELADEVYFEACVQWLFAEQWTRLRERARDKNVTLVGDLPIFVAHDSADVWQHRERFQLDSAGEPACVAGVPPDYFSATGQRWGNPLYDWARMKKTGYAWWIARFAQMLERFDAIRLDHFIGFHRYWAIPATCPTAIDGAWTKGPGADFFSAVEKALGTLPMIAEDLGAITPAVTRLRRQFGFPSIRILQFAFGTDPSAPKFMPHNYVHNAVVYTGTHDNDTTLGWFREEGGDESTRTREQTEHERKTARAYLASNGDAIHWDMIRACAASVARWAIFPMQDVLGLGNDARMNHPGRDAGNWAWRCTSDALSPHVAERLATLAQLYGRAPTGAQRKLP